MLWAVRWYCRYPINYRDLETMMTERGVAVDHSTIYRWVQRFAPEMEKHLRWQWRRPPARPPHTFAKFATEPYLFTFGPVFARVFVRGSIA